jgi:hypothetical protein
MPFVNVANLRRPTSFIWTWNIYWNCCFLYICFLADLHQNFRAKLIRKHRDGLSSWISNLQLWCFSWRSWQHSSLFDCYPFWRHSVHKILYAMLIRVLNYKLGSIIRSPLFIRLIVNLESVVDEFWGADCGVPSAPWNAKISVHFH